VSIELDEIFQPLKEHVQELEAENLALRRMLDTMGRASRDTVVGQHGGVQDQPASIPLQMSLMLEAFNQRLQSLANETSARLNAVEEHLSELTSGLNAAGDHLFELNSGLNAAGAHSLATKDQLDGYINDLARLTRRVDGMNEAMRGLQNTVQDEQEDKTTPFFPSDDSW
jgi:septal ring factor EnvC (AmiA/AmiB activator)